MIIIPALPIKAKPKTKKNFRPYNRYNIYFTLEREKIILTKGGLTTWQKDTWEPQPIKRGYENLNIPPLPPRFSHLDVPEGWCMPGEQKRRPHRRSHGVATFCELARSIATSWKAIDDETMNWCTTVEKIIKKRHVELEKNAKKASSNADANPSPVKIKDGPCHDIRDFCWDLCIEPSDPSEDTDFASIWSIFNSQATDSGLSDSEYQGKPCFEHDFSNAHPTRMIMKDNTASKPDVFEAANVTDDEIIKMWCS